MIQNKQKGLPRPELLLPSGSFDSALAAIDGGADALYFGFADFSARKQARNLDFLEYRRLLRYAREKGVKLYAAINTVILERELPEVAQLLAFIGRFPPDAVIVQDWGLARLIRVRHPRIAVHASTQTAIQGLAAARIAAELGATRIVLPRETPLSEMRRISADFPEMELEVFVHGALCYSFSGLCLASGTILGRSGNRGECAQLCRSYYDAETAESSGGGRGYWFSCRDLSLVDRVEELRSAGICSLKVEGRMKSPEYCYAVARLYRAALDGLPSEELASRRESAQTAFSREGTEGWLFERGGQRLIDLHFPGHRGSPVGTFRSSGGGRAVIELSSSLGLRDGLLAFEGPESTKPLQFAVTDLRDHRSGRPLTAGHPGDLVELDCPGSPRSGSEARRISDRRQDRKVASPEEFPPALQEISLRLSIEGAIPAASFRGEIELPDFGASAGSPGPALDGAIGRIEAGEVLSLESARKAGGFLKALSVFSESGDADFRLVPAGDLSRLADLFVPPSALKREKNRFYERSSALLQEAQELYAKASLEPPARPARCESRPVVLPPPRATLVFAHEDLPSGLPFATPRILREEAGAALPRSGGVAFLPLAPLVLEWDAYADLVRKRVRRELEAGAQVSLGLDALHHIAFARELLAELGGVGEGLSFFIDIHLYVANRLALEVLDGLVPRIAFAYAYLESPLDPAISSLPGLPPLFPMGPDFEPPLFLSLGCLRKHHVERGSCPADCRKTWTLRLADRDRRYLALVEDCVSMLFRLPQGARAQ